ncbi:hypothetical protein EW146_g10044, partial [Bondarzewia mesenterica]
VVKEEGEIDSTPAPAAGSMKRKKLTQGYRDDVDAELESTISGTGTRASGTSSVKKRKVEEGSSRNPAAGSSRPREREREREQERESRDTLPVPRKLMNAKGKEREREREREISPLPRRAANREKERGRDMSPRIRKVKRELSPLPPPRTAARRDREQVKSKASGLGKRRRGSPIFTSSEDDRATPVARTSRAHDHPHARPTPSTSATGTASPSDISSRLPRPPLLPLPDDAKALLKRYQHGYPLYIKIYQLLVELKSKISEVLNGSDEDDELENGELRELSNPTGAKVLVEIHEAWRKELLAINSILENLEDPIE